MWVSNVWIWCELWDLQKQNMCEMQRKLHPQSKLYLQLLKVSLRYLMFLLENI